MATFSGDIRRWNIKSMDTIDKIRRASILEMFQLIIYSTPVESGRLRGNWQTNVNSSKTGELDRLDTSGSMALAEVMANMGGLMDTVYFTNNLPYAERIEYDGWSYKERAGMVRKHLVQWQRIVENKAREFA